MARPALPIVPAAFFGIVLGLAGWATAWRGAHRVWHLPAFIGETLMGIAALVWLVVLASFVWKWIAARDAAIAEVEHPVQCCFIALAGVTTMLIAAGLMPYARGPCLLLFIIGAAFTAAFAAWRTGALWRGGRDPANNTPVLYLPTVGAGFVGAIGAAAFGRLDWARVAFGAGLFSWLAIESVLIHRLYTATPLAVPLRPTLGIQFAPAMVGAMAWLAASSGPPDWLAHALFGYGLLQALVVAGLLRWIGEQPFAASYWGFTFGITAMAVVPLRMIERGDTGAIVELAPFIFVAANLAMLWIVVGTLRLIAQHRLLPTVPIATVPNATATNVSSKA